MANFVAGQKVLIKLLDVQPGPLNEMLVVIQSEPANLSGFVDGRYLVKKGETTFLQGIVRGVTKEGVQLSLPGSFFTTAAGIASMSRDWAKHNVEAAT
jgi:hypothetical protein